MLVERLQTSLAAAANDLASSTRGTFLVAIALQTDFLTVPPMPSTAPLPWELAK